MKRLEWVPVPNRMDSFEYGTLVDHPNGAAHLGAWLVILKTASRQDPRGTLPHGGAGLSQALAVISRLPAALFDEVIPRLVKLQWIEQIATLPHDGAGIPHDGAVEGKGREGKELNGREAAAFVSRATEPPPSHEDLKAQIKTLAVLKSMSDPAEDRRKICKQLIMGYPDARGLPGEPDAIIVAKCLTLADDSTEDLAAALRSMYLAQKKPQTSWAWFPVVLQQYLIPREKKA